jgi:hypothetical protein
MGRERTRSGQFIYICIASLILFLAPSCTTLKKQLVSTREAQVVSTPEAHPKTVETRGEPQKPIPGCPEVIEIYVGKEIRAEEVQKETEPQKPIREGLGRAEDLLKKGSYYASLKENERVLSFSGKNPPGDSALFNMGLIYAHSKNPKKDYEKSLGFFNRVIEEYPRSPLVEEARIWVMVLQENEKLKQVIEKFKEVDITVEEKQRMKAR